MYTFRSWVVRGNKCRQLLLVHVLFFGLLFPALCFWLDLRHSVYSGLFHTAFLAHSTAADAIVLQKLTQDNDARLEETRDILHDYSFERRALRGPRFTLLNDEKAARDNKKIQVAVTIVAAPRGSYKVGNTVDYRPKYLSQNVAKFLKLTMDEVGEKSSVEYTLVVCDVAAQRGEEALELSSALRDVVTVVHYQDSSHSQLPPDPDAARLSTKLYRFYKEKRDYSFCINETSDRTNADYILLVEDDAIPKANAISMTTFLIENYLESSKLSINNRSKGNVGYFKLYHPKRLSGYISLEVERIAELIATGLVVGTFLYFMYILLVLRTTPEAVRKKAAFHWSLSCMYVTIVILLIGRPHLQGWRQMSPQLHSITPDAFCCTQGLLFPADSALRLSEYISTQPSDSKLRKDDLVFRFQQQHKPGYLLQPNLFEHVGVMSSLRARVVDPHLMLE